MVARGSPLEDHTEFTIVEISLSERIFLSPVLLRQHLSNGVWTKVRKQKLEHSE